MAHRLPDGMGEERHRELQNMREAARSRKNKFDVGYFNEDGKWVHITRVSGEEDAHDAAERLDDPDEEARDLIGLTGDEEIEVRPTS